MTQAPLLLLLLRGRTLGLDVRAVLGPVGGEELVEDVALSELEVAAADSLVVCEGERSTMEP